VLVASGPGGAYSAVGSHEPLTCSDFPVLILHYIASNVKNPYPPEEFYLAGIKEVESMKCVFN
jgi:hypothetical protein